MSMTDLIINGTTYARYHYNTETKHFTFQHVQKLRESLTTAENYEFCMGIVCCLIDVDDMRTMEIKNKDFETIINTRA